MKRIVLFLAFVSITTTLFAQADFFYTDKGVKETFKVRKDKVILRAQSAEKAKTLAKETVFRSAYDVGDWVIATVDTLQVKREDLTHRQGIIDAIYALEYVDGTLLYPTNQIFVESKKGQSIEKLFEITGLRKCVEKTELFDSYSELYLITLNVYLGDILQICRNLFESGLCKSASPSSFREIKPHNTHYPRQWGLKNTGQSGGILGIDIKAEQAWAISNRSANIRMAVIDEGVDLTHPDLQANLLPGFDATVNAPGGVNGSPFGHNAHGTACAGIIGAVNNSIGVVGVMSNVRIIPIRIAYTATGSANWTCTEQWIANGINHAWQVAHADVLSCSWGGGPWSPAITNAINNAVNNGRVRNGVNLGCTVVFASGNDHASSVSYPADNTSVIAVGAIDRYGSRADFSNYGSALDVVAPGVDIYTTGILGATGYGTVINNGMNGVYFSGFNGTSAACPQVAGVAALILSVRPNLTQVQVRNAIESTCTKLSGYIYSTAKPNGRWNNQVGYGLINAYAAVSSIAPKVSGPTLVLNAGSAYTLNLNGNSGGSVTWTYSPNLQMLSSSNTAITVKPYGNGLGWIQASVGGVSTPRYEVWAGKPVISEITGEGDVPNLQESRFIAKYDSRAAIINNSFQWILNPLNGNSLYDYDGGFLYIAFYNTGNYQLVVRASNVNGVGEYYVTGVNVYDPSSYSSSSSSLYRAYPNPVSDELTVSPNPGITSIPAQSAGGNKTAGNKAYTVYLYNANGASVRQSVSQGDQTQLNVSGLPGGIYYLMIDTGDGSRPEVHKIIVKH